MVQLWSSALIRTAAATAASAAILVFPRRTGTATAASSRILSAATADAWIAAPRNSRCFSVSLSSSSLSSSSSFDSGFRMEEQQQQQTFSSGRLPATAGTTTIASNTMRAIVYNGLYDDNDDIENNNDNTASTTTTTTRGIPRGKRCHVQQVTLPIPQLHKQAPSTPARLWGKLLPSPSTQQKYVLVRVHAVSLNPVDAKWVIGDKIPSTWTAARRIFQRRVLHGKIVGFDFAGTVVDVDVNVDIEEKNTDDSTAATARPAVFRVGDAVFGSMPPLQGTLAEYIVAPTHQIAKMPQPSPPQQSSWTATTTGSDVDPFVQAAALPLTGLTAFQCLQPLLGRAERDNNDNSNSMTRKKSVLIVGASGGTGIMALQMTLNCFSSSDNDDYNTVRHVTAICSARNFDWVRRQSALSTTTAVVDATADSLNKKDTETPEENENRRLTLVDYTAAAGKDALIEQLRNSPGYPYDVVMDCVTSDDPRDTAPFYYPSLLQDPRHHLLSSSYVYRRLGGVWSDWIRAGMARIMGVQCWKNENERLFWICFPYSQAALQQLAAWMQQGKLHPPVRHGTFDFTAEAVLDAMDLLLSRRVQGKLVVQLVPTANTTTTATPHKANSGGDNDNADITHEEEKVAGTTDSKKDQ